MEPVASGPSEEQAPPSTAAPETVAAPPQPVPVPAPADSAQSNDPPAPEKDLKVQENAAAEAIEKLAGPAKDCSIALLDLQRQRDDLFHSYLAEIRALELRYQGLYGPLYTQRKATLVQHNQLEGFWLKAMKGNMMVKGYIFEKDEELLKHLVDIRCVEEPQNDDFTLEFEFSENPHISDTVLSKRFVHDVDTDLEKAVGCEIHWKGENFTEKKIKKKKSKKGKTQMIVKTVPNPSFFSFFVTRTADEEDDEEEMDDEEEFHMNMMEDDEDLGVEIRDEIIPNALLFFLGVRQTDDMEGIEVDDDDSDDDEEHPSKPQRKKSKGDKDKKTVDASGKGKEECKNQ